MPSLLEGWFRNWDTCDFRRSSLLQVVFYLITLLASLGVCLELLRPLLFPQLPLPRGPLLPRSRSFQGPAGRSPVLLLFRVPHVQVVLFARNRALELLT